MIIRRSAQSYKRTVAAAELCWVGRTMQGQRATIERNGHRIVTAGEGKV